MIKICPNCNKQTALLNNVCEHCGCKTIVCEECGSVYEDGKTVCDYCGYEFPTKEQKAEREEKKSIQNTKRQADELLSFTFATNKRYYFIGEGIILAGVIFLIIALWMVLDFGNYSYRNETDSLELLLRAAQVQRNAKIFLGIGLLVFLVGSFIVSLRTVFSSSAITYKADILKFDYLSYYKALNTNEKGQVYITMGNAINPADVQLICAFKYKYQPSAKTGKIWLNILWSFILAVAFIFTYFGLAMNIDSYIIHIASATSEAFKFILNVSLIIAIIILVAQIVLSSYVGNDVTSAQKWLKQIKVEKQ